MSWTGRRLRRVRWLQKRQQQPSPAHQSVDQAMEDLLEELEEEIEEFVDKQERFEQMRKELEEEKKRQEQKRGQRQQQHERQKEGKKQERKQQSGTQQSQEQQRQQEHGKKKQEEKTEKQQQGSSNQEQERGEGKDGGGSGERGTYVQEEEKEGEARTSQQEQEKKGEKGRGEEESKTGGKRGEEKREGSQEKRGEQNESEGSGASEDRREGEEKEKSSSKPSGFQEKEEVEGKEEREEKRERESRGETGKSEETGKDHGGEMESGVQEKKGSSNMMGSMEERGEGEEEEVGKDEGEGEELEESSGRDTGLDLKKIIQHSVQAHEWREKSSGNKSFELEETSVSSSARSIGESIIELSKLLSNLDLKNEFYRRKARKKLLMNKAIKRVIYGYPPSYAYRYVESEPEIIVFFDTSGSMSGWSRMIEEIFSFIRKNAPYIKVVDAPNMYVEAVYEHKKKKLDFEESEETVMASDVMKLLNPVKDETMIFIFTDSDGIGEAQKIISEGYNVVVILPPNYGNEFELARKLKGAKVIVPRSVRDVVVGLKYVLSNPSGSYILFVENGVPRTTSF